MLTTELCAQHILKLTPPHNAVCLLLFQSFKRKPGQADNERSTGDHSQHIHKRLRTRESSCDTEQVSEQPEQNVGEADAFEHIKQGCESYDAQTYGMSAFTT